VICQIFTFWYFLGVEKENIYLFINIARQRDFFGVFDIILFWYLLGVKI